MTIEPKISKYVNDRIDIAIERERKIFNKDMRVYVDGLTEESKRHMTVLKEFFRDEVTGLAELIQERPTRDEVREISREEIEAGLRPVNAKLDFLNEERHAMLDAIADIKA